MEQWTIQKLLNWICDYFEKSNIDSPRLSAEIILSHVLNLGRIELYTNFDKLVARPDLEKLRGLVKRASENEPVAYLTGRCEFYSLALTITPDCLIPRPETELLVERAIEFLRSRNTSQSVCDLCTGSGCIAVAIAKNHKNCEVIATDISDDALKVAKQNIERYSLTEKIKLFQGDLFEPLIPQLDKCKFDLIVCNPPYVTSGEYDTLDKNVKNYEPKNALEAGTDGLDIYRRIIESIEPFLKSDAALILEIGHSQGKSVRELLENTGYFTQIDVKKDFQDNDRVVIARKQAIYSN